MNASRGSITGWFAALQGGDRDGAGQLWDRFSRRLLVLARRKLQDTPRGPLDEEDVALSAFDSFCRGAEKGRFADLEDRDDLWRLLALITVRKAIDYRQHESRRKRGGLAPAPAAGGELESLLSREPDPELATMAAEECRRLLGLLGDHDLRAIALGRMEGFNDDEIAQRLGCARRTVQRRLRLIRQLWEQEAS